MDPKNWIVKNEKPQSQPEPFEKIVARIIDEHPEWTEEDCKNWRDETDWHVGQAMRIRSGQFQPKVEPAAWIVDERHLQ